MEFYIPPLDVKRVNLYVELRGQKFWHNQKIFSLAKHKPVSLNSHGNDNETHEALGF